jgi:hypothetical protein
MNNVNSASASACKSKSCSAPSPRAFCEGIFQHTMWCASRDPGASYAYQIVVDASKITLADSLILHSLGVAWGGVHS